MDPRRKFQRVNYIRDENLYLWGKILDLGKKRVVLSY